METIRMFRGETLTLATTLGFPQVRGIPPWANRLVIEPLHASTTENLSVGFGPAIKKIWFYDASVGTGTYTDLTANLTDRNASRTSGSSLNSMTSSDFIYIGAYRRFAGMAVDVVNTNTEVSAMAVTYWNGTAWANITPTDGTVDGGNITLSKDGLVTWTMPTDWALTTVNGSQEHFWVRIAVSATLDTTVSIDEIQALLNTTVSADNSSYEGLARVLIQTNNRTLPPYVFDFHREQMGEVEIISTSLTTAINLNWYQVVR